MPIARPTATSSSGRYSAGKPKLMPHSRSPRAMTKTPATGPRARGDRRAALAADEVWTGRPVEVDRNRRGRVLLRLELLDRVDDRGGGVADRGCDLARQLRTDVARRIQAGKAGLHRRIRHEEAERIVLHVVAVIEELDVRLEADEDEDAGVLAVLCFDHLPVASPMDGGDAGRLQVHPELDRLVGHPLGKLGPGDVVKAGIVLDRLGVQQLATRRPSLEQDRFHPGAASVKRGGEPGRTPADDDYVVAAILVHQLRNSHVN